MGVNHEPMVLKAPTLDTLLEEVPFIYPEDTRDYWVEKLDATGTGPFLNMLAAGFLPAEIATANSLPLVFFQEWFERNVDKTALRHAMRSCAQMAVARSQAVLQGIPANQGHALTKRALAERLAWIAERADSERWGTSKAPAAPQIPVNITLNLGPGVGMKSIPTADTPLMIEGEAA